MVSISVAMATFNSANFLPEQLDSIRNQTLAPKELIVTDDGSSDNTVEIVKEFAVSSPFPVRIICNPSRMGYRANFMNSFEHHDADVIAVSDQDDIWDIRKLEIAARSFLDPSVTLFCHDDWLIDDDGSQIGEADVIRLRPNNPPLSFYPLVNPLNFAIVFRRDLIALSKFWQLSIDTWERGNRMAHDQWLSFIASSYGTIVFSDEKLVPNRQHANNTYGWTKASVFAKYVDKLRNPGLKYQLLADTVSARAHILELASAEVPLAWRARSTEAARKYRQLSRRLALRSEIYLGNKLFSRMRALNALYKDRAYSRNTSWDLSRASLGRDLIFGTALRRIMITPTSNKGSSALQVARKLDAKMVKITYSLPITRSQIRN